MIVNGYLNRSWEVRDLRHGPFGNTSISMSGGFSGVVTAWRSAIGI